MFRFTLRIGTGYEFELVAFRSGLQPMQVARESCCLVEMVGGDIVANSIGEKVVACAEAMESCTDILPDIGSADFDFKPGKKVERSFGA